jgi:hypothetical protein
MGMLANDGPGQATRLQGRSYSMFETLDDRMKHDDEETSTLRERLTKWVLIGLVAVALCGGIFLAIRQLS